MYLGAPGLGMSKRNANGWSIDLLFACIMSVDARNWETNKMSMSAQD
jgi:hypothetical protein